MKYVTATHTFRVPDEATDDQIGGLIAAMGVQIEEPVDMQTGEDLPYSVDEITSRHEVVPMCEVWIMSWVYGITGDGDTDGGGFDWLPIEEERAARESFKETCDGFKGTPTRGRLLRAWVPDLRIGPTTYRILGGVQVNTVHTTAEDADEAVREQVTTWLDHFHHEDMEYHWPAEETRWVYDSDPQRAVLLKDLLYLRRVDPEYPGRRRYEAHADESAEIKAWLRDHGPEGELSEALAIEFPNELGEVMDEVMGDTESTELITRDQVESWLGHKLTDEDYDRLEQAIPNSSIPDAIRTIVSEAMGVNSDD